MRDQYRMRICSSCRIRKPAEAFHAGQFIASRRLRRCIECVSLPFSPPPRRCVTCGAEKPAVDFNRPGVKPFGRARVCATCAAEWKRTPSELARQAAYYATYPERVRAANAAYQARHREEFRIVVNAGYAVREAVKAGRLVRPSTCEECSATDRRIDAAHHDYSQPLDVRWLCKPCHGRWDRAEPKIMGQLAASA